MRFFTQGLQAGWAAALDAVLPPRCLSCGATIGRGGELCLDCWPLVTQLAPPQCDACGAPFPHDQGKGARCGACLGDPPPFGRARAAFLYDEGSRGLVLGFKHADRTEAAPAFARWMARAGKELLEDCDALVPVPLHWRRLFKRRYNQAALLALHLGRLAEKPVLSGGLKRIKSTSPQGHLSPQARTANIAGAFQVPKSQHAAIAGKSLLLIDDVLTTGATARLATRVLLKAGAAKVDVLTLALVPRLST